MELAVSRSVAAEEPADDGSRGSSHGSSPWLQRTGSILLRSLSWKRYRPRAEQAEDRRRAEAERAAERNDARARADAATAQYLRRVDPFTGGPVLPGDLRMCGRCHAGPWRKTGCNNMRTHNTFFSSHNSDHTRNRCRNCLWFESDWTKWPEWDGVIGPH